MSKQEEVRKGIALSIALWERVSEFRFNERIRSEREAVRVLLERGLQRGREAEVVTK